MVKSIKDRSVSGNKLLKGPGDPDKIIDGKSFGTKFEQRDKGGCFLKKMAAG